MSQASLITLCAAISQIVAAASTPHLIFVFFDDYGWNNVGYHSNQYSNESVTPTIDGLVSSGVELDRHHVFQYCSPSRSALHTGRNPIHVNVLNSFLDQHNPADPVSGFQGIPRNMSTLPAKLKTAGYATHMVGKWHCGMATPAHTPQGRGYDTALHYFCGANDYWTEQGVETNCTQTFTDLFNTSAPAFGQNNSWSCSQGNQPNGCLYEDELFTASIVNTIQSHDPAIPFFAYIAFHNVHAPLEVPADQLARFSWIDNPGRQSYAAMVNLMDANLGRIVAALQAKGMWDNTVLVGAADNGGPTMSAANNYPLRGSKMSNWQGGTRGNAFVSGGYVPPSQRGKKLEGFVAIEDWYTTYCALAGVDPSDPVGVAAGLPPVDGLNVWPYVSGSASTSPRTEFWTGLSSNGIREGTTLVQGITNASTGYELLVGQLPVACWQGPLYPNNSATKECDAVVDCGFPDAPSPVSGKTGCLFNLFTDPTQHHDVAEQYPDIVKSMYKRLQEVNATAFSPNRGLSDPAACETFQHRWGGFYGPFLPP